MKNIQGYSTFIIFSLLLLFTFTTDSRSQIVQTSGDATEASSQLIYYYDTEFVNGDMLIQVTNTSDVEAVTIHVQIFRNDDPDNEDATPNVICDERNFVDELTPNDTHIYDLKQPGLVKNAGETESAAGDSTAIDVDRTKGFVVITPVVSEADLTAISFQNLMGLTVYEQGFDETSFLLNAMGRDAVDFTTGQVVADGTPLDGVTNGFVLLQPAEMDFDFMGYAFGGLPRVDVVGFVFEDVYGEAGLLGYQVEPGDSSWNSFIFDFKEDPTSCGNKAINCFATFGLNDTFVQNNTDFVEDVLCSGSETPPYPQENLGVSHFGWTRIFVSGLEGLENQVALFINGNTSGAEMMPPRTQLEIDSTNQLDHVIIVDGDNSFGGGWMYTN